MEIAEPHGDAEYSGFWVYIYKNDKNLSPEEWKKQKSEYNKSDDKIEKIIISEVEGIKVTEPFGFEQVDVILGHKGYIYSLTQIGLNGNVYNNILSTYKFIK